MSTPVRPAPPPSHRLLRAQESDMWKVALLILNNGAPPPSRERHDRAGCEEHEEWMRKAHATRIIPPLEKKTSARKKKN